MNQFRASRDGRTPWQLRMRRGMTVQQRQKLRELLLAREMDKARTRAAEAYLSPECKQAMLLHGTLAAERHASCPGEKPPHSGCLCYCHDDNRSGVVSGTSTEMGPDVLHVP